MIWVAGLPSSAMGYFRVDDETRLYKLGSLQQQRSVRKDYSTRPCLPPEGAEFKKSECVKLVVDRQAMKFLWDGQMLRSPKLLLLCPRGADEIKSCPFDSQVEIDRSIRQRHGLIYHWRRSRYNIYWFLRASVYLWERR